ITHSGGVHINTYCVVVGGANVDLLGVPDHRLEERTSNPGRIISSPGGVARNIAENLARLEQPCGLMAPLGADAYGAWLKQNCADLGIEVSGLVTMAGEATSSYLSIVDETGDMQIAVADMTLIDQFGSTHLQPYLAQLESASIVILDANLAPHCLSFLTQGLPTQNLFVDTVSVAKAPRLKPFLSCIHSLKPNLAEAQAIADIDLGPAPSNTELAQLAQWFRQQGVKHVYLSLGSRGVLYAGPEQQFIMAAKTPVPASKIINSNGAGDAMMAALCAGWMLGLNAPQRAAWGLACAHIAMLSEATINCQLNPSLLQLVLKEHPCQITHLP
ncbi:MAG: carbohydrate kinase family protein, partial [Gammaproteobacteria bacterium]|nr:carbohydrate kinase family protein [Gammaproteobacteria bacterium]